MSCQQKKCLREWKNVKFYALVTKCEADTSIEQLSRQLTWKEILNLSLRYIKNCLYTHPCIKTMKSTQHCYEKKSVWYDNSRDWMNRKNTKTCIEKPQRYESKQTLTHTAKKI